MSLTIAIKSLFNIELDNDHLMQMYIASNDPKLLAKLYDNCGDHLFHFLVTQSSYDMAKDISQKTWLKVIDNKQMYRANGHFKAWLFAIARHLLIDEIRQQRYLTDDGLAVIAAAHIPQTNEAIERAFDEALLALPFEQREAFVLQQEGFGIQQIATITHSETETVKSRLRYAKQSLRSKLDIYYD
ncbi:sigma-70 family RNA polymerase sigma factor [Neptunicella sp. SCSIO 80796]|uniref:sigma-70 family RNA polymerase sigma factor n=1 Tax=Neptunicella plasticusilytica TaxID=3117012 RepID=UPI003A4D459C